MAKKRGKLQMVVNMLESEEIRDNLRELLKRWDFSYSYRPRDSYSLQFTTRIEFNEFVLIDLLKEL